MDTIAFDLVSAGPLAVLMIAMIAGLMAIAIVVVAWVLMAIASIIVTLSPLVIVLYGVYRIVHG